MIFVTLKYIVIHFLYLSNISQIEHNKSFIIAKKSF